MSINFSDIFDNAAEDGYGPSLDLASGKYEGTFKFGKAGETKSGHPSLGFIFEADAGSVSETGTDMGGGTAWFNLYFTPAAANFAARDAKRLGLTAAMLETDMEAAAQVVVGQRWAVTLKPSKDGQYVNVYLDKALGETGAVKADTPTPPAAAPAAEGVWDI
jgi:hypothetical protein